MRPLIKIRIVYNFITYNISAYLPQFFSRSWWLTVYPRGLLGDLSSAADQFGARKWGPKFHVLWENKHQLTPQAPAGWWLSPTPLKNMTSSVGMMTFPSEWNIVIYRWFTH